MVRVRHEALVQPPVLHIQRVLVFIELLHIINIFSIWCCIIVAMEYHKGGIKGGREGGMEGAKDLYLEQGMATTLQERSQLFAAFHSIPFDRFAWTLCISDTECRFEDESSSDGAKPSVPIVFWLRLELHDTASLTCDDET